MAKLPIGAGRGLLGGTNGKGDKERSPGWRNNYDDINFHRGETPNEFTRVSHNRIRKVYGPGPIKPEYPLDPITIEQQNPTAP